MQRNEKEKKHNYIVLIRDIIIHAYNLKTSHKMQERERSNTHIMTIVFCKDA